MSNHLGAPGCAKRKGRVHYELLFVPFFVGYGDTVLSIKKVKPHACMGSVFDIWTCQI